MPSSFPFVTRRRGRSADLDNACHHLAQSVAPTARQGVIVAQIVIRGVTELELRALAEQACGASESFVGVGPPLPSDAPEEDRRPAEVEEARAEGRRRGALDMSRTESEGRLVGEQTE